MASFAAQAPDPKTPMNLQEQVRHLEETDVQVLSQEETEDLIEIVLDLKTMKIPAEVNRLNTAAGSLRGILHEVKSADEMEFEATKLSEKIETLEVIWRKLSQHWNKIRLEEKRKAS